jgi:methylmalonyl-CoA mutase
MPAFPAATHDDWMRRVEAVLKGAAFEKVLVGRTGDGIAIEPLYPGTRGGEPVVRAEGPSRWRVMQRTDVPDEETGARLAVDDLQGGADGLVVVCAGSRTARGFGINASDARSLDLALEGTLIEAAPLRLETAPFDGRRVAALDDDLLARRNLRPEEVEIDFGLDPVGDLSRTGALPAPWPTIAERFAGAVARLRKRGYRGTQARIDGRAWHEAGASQAQELAAMLATGVAYLRALEAQGMALDEARASLSFLAVADADEFLTVAKLRALRLLWARVEEACGLTPRPILLAAETAWRMLGRRDPWVNLLRNTMAVFSAVIGGADSIAVLPFTAALGLPDAFARRLARNTQTVLMEESNLWRVADPAAGAGGFEALTEALCEKAWELFQAIEAEGGIVESLQAGALQERIAIVAAADAHAVATRRAPLTGTSEFPHLAEAPVAVLQPAPAATSPAPLALPSRRRAEPFERLRDASDAYLARHGQRPRVFLAPLGSLAEFSARAGFIRNLLEAGGIEAVGGDSAVALAELAAAFAKAGAPIACLCGPDALYASEGATAVAALKAAGAHVVLAGRPGDLEAPLREAGLAGSLHAGCDTIAALTELHHVLGIPREACST